MLAFCLEMKIVRQQEEGLQDECAYAIADRATPAANFGWTPGKHQ